MADASIAARLRLDAIIEVVLALQQVRPTDQFEDARVAHIGWACLKQGHTLVRLGQASGHNGAGGAAADHEVVIMCSRH